MKFLWLFDGINCLISRHSYCKFILRNFCNPNHYKSLSFILTNDCAIFEHFIYNSKTSCYKQLKNNTINDLPAKVGKTQNEKRYSEVNLSLKVNVIQKANPI